MVLGALGASWGGLGASWYVLGASWGVLWAFWGRLGSPLGRLEGKKVANIAPTWLPKRSQNPSKIEAQIDHFFNASWDRIFEGFWWIWEGKMEASWHPDGIKNRCQLGKAIFSKNFIFLKKT